MTSVSEPAVLLGQALAPSNRVDPYPAYRELREYGPLQIPEISLTVLTSYADCDAALRHPASASDRTAATMRAR